MRGRTLLIDRVLGVLIGLILLAAGAAAWLWYFSFGLTFDTISTSALRRQLDSAWWPWALGAVGVVLIVLGLRRLVAHLPQRGVHALRLPGSRDFGGLTVISGALTTAASDQLEEVAGVRSVRGQVRLDRRELVLDFVATVEPSVELRDIARACDAVAGETAGMLGRSDLSFRFDVRVPRRARALPRVG